jgi:DNA-binding CsgD family transcriptional regulator
MADKVARVSSGIASPRLIGREPELARLASLSAAAGTGTFALALVKGDAGIGKTRLVGEFAGSAASRDTLVLSGSCMAIGGEDAPYGPLVRALRGVPADELEAAARALPEVMVAELTMLIPTLSHTPELLRESSRGAQGRQYEYLLELLARIAESRPVVLVIEDIHWADPSTHHFLLFIARNARRERVLVIATYRLHDAADLQAMELYLGELERCATVASIPLGSLTEAQVREQITAILEQPADVGDSHRISARTQGNPFYVEELIAHGATTEVPLPRSQAAALLVRVRALGERSQHVLQVLAAFGRAVHHDLLAAAAGLSEPALTDALRPAVDEYVVEADATAFTFRHALTREAVYDALLPGERRRLHRAVAAALHDRPHMTDAAELAVQWRAAEEPQAALAASIAAAQAAAGVYAYSEAVEHYKGVVSLWEPGQVPEPDVDRAQILLDAADAANRAGVEDLPIEWCRLGLAALGDDPDPRRAAAFYERLGRFQGHRLDTSLKYYRRALACLDDAPSAERARLLGDEALTLSLSVRWDEARDRAERSLAVALEAGAESEAGFARSVLGLMLGYLGAFDAAEEHLLQACRISETHERPDDATRAYVHLGEVRRLRGDLPGACAVMGEGMEAARRLGVEASYGRYFALNAAEDEYELGRWSAAQHRLDALEGASLTWTETLLLHAVSGQLATGRGELERARVWLDAARSQLRDSSATEWTAYVGAAAIELELTAGRPADALAMAERELQRVQGREEQLYTPGLVAVAVRASADVASSRGPDAEAALRGAEQQVAWLAGFLDDRSPPIALAHLAGARAELDRARGVAAPASWSAVAAEWDRLTHPYRVAYAKLREAEAIRETTRDRSLVAEPLGKALTIAHELGAQPLETRIETLTRQARVQSVVVRQLATSGPQDVLTNREREVLALLAKGHSNKRIGEQLYITTRTAGLHVSRILHKLDVSNRHEAAAVARRHGLVADD